MILPGTKNSSESETRAQPSTPPLAASDAPLQLSTQPLTASGSPPSIVADEEEHDHDSEESNASHPSGGT